MCNQIEECDYRVYGRLTSVGPIYRVQDTKHPNRTVRMRDCRCDCGSGIKPYRVSNINKGHTNSCGCLQIERASEAKRVHGMYGTPIYGTYRSALRRCYETQSQYYADYGGRGIRVCDRWLEPGGQGFINFRSDMGPKPSDKHSIDRIDVNGHYEPGNCRWATKVEQGNNKRNNVLIHYNGVTKTLAQWGVSTGLGSDIISQRLLMKWPLERALTQPSRQKSRHHRAWNHAGETLTIPEWAKRLGVPAAILRKRLAMGWSISRTLTQPWVPRGPREVL